MSDTSPRATRMLLVKVDTVFQKELRKKLFEKDKNFTQWLNEKIKEELDIL